MALTSFYTALSGINSNSQAINVIGDNLANMNTVGFKSGKASFSEVLGGVAGTSATGNPIVSGLGSTLNGVSHNLTNGVFNGTGTSTDVAIEGNGYFVVSLGDGVGYTRSGQFQYDATGNLLSSDGYFPMGYMATNGIINQSAGVGPIEIRLGQLLPANATTEMSLAANLDAQAAVNDTFATSVQVYDSLGSKHNVTVTFTKTGTLQWGWNATIPAEDVGGLPGATASIGSGAMTFDANGILTAPAANPPLAITGLANGASNMSIEFKMWDNQGVPVITDAASVSGTSTTTQNGYAASPLTNIIINNDGVIVGETENGNTVNLAQLALAVFPNSEGLKKYNGSTFSAFPSAGEPSIGTAGSGGRGVVRGGGLELSNVDMAGEFINLIVAQRSYQANTRVITTSDELYQEAINLKR